jgi:hypothetical protein
VRGISAIAPTASAHSAAIASSTTRSTSGSAVLGIARTAPAPSATLAERDLGRAQAVLCRIAADA